MIFLGPKAFVLGLDQGDQKVIIEVVQIEIKQICCFLFIYIPITFHGAVLEDAGISLESVLICRLVSMVGSAVLDTYGRLKLFCSRHLKRYLLVLSLKLNVYVSRCFSKRIKFLGAPKL